MNRFITYCATAALASLSFVSSASSNAFVAWEVTNVAWDDVLNVRAWPSSKSAIQAAYPNETRLSMTGRCMNGVDLKDIAGMPADVQSDQIRYTWCEVWHDPKGSDEWQNGWVYGRYISPMQQ